MIMKETDFFLIFLIILGAAFFTAFVAELIWQPKHTEKTLINYYELLIKGIKQNTLDEDSISRIYKRCNEKLYSFFFVFNYSYERFLDSFLIYVREKDEDGTLTKSAHELLDTIFEKIKDENPYSSVNERERRILLSIVDTMKKSKTITESERSATKHNLNELALALEENQNALAKSKKANRWSIPVSIIGTLLTILFGLLQLFQ